MSTLNSVAGVSISSPSGEGGGHFERRPPRRYPLWFPLVLLQVKAVGRLIPNLPSVTPIVSISSPSGEGGGNII